MSKQTETKVVVDTNVLFEGLTKQGGASGLIIDWWRQNSINVYVSNALAYEYVDVLSRKLSSKRWLQTKPVLGFLLKKTHFTIIHYSWRPTSPDAGDDLVIDCAMNSNAIVVTFNVRDFNTAIESLGLQVMTPVQFVNKQVNKKLVDEGGK